MNSSHRLTPLARAFIIVCVSKLFSLVPFTYVLGTFKTIFSLSNITGPLVGAFGGVWGAFSFFTGNLVWALFFKKSILFSSFAFSGIATVCASLYWACASRFVRIGIPALCMLLFVVHPIGMHAWPYAFFWLIPCTIAFQKKQHIFFTALGSTFTAHAVGSVLWLYGTAMAAEHWYALMPLVPGERFLCAAGMTAVYFIFSWIFFSLPRIRFQSITFSCMQ